MVYVAVDYFIPGEVGSKKAQRVAFDNVQNCRQLGGYVNAQGKTVRYDVLFRSGKLCKLTENGIEELRKKNVTKVIDLRIPEERADKPDPEIPGIKNICINIADPNSNFYKMSVWGVGVSYENYDSVVTAIAKLDMDLGDMYIDGIIESPYGRKALKEVFSILANHQNGAILWHCSGGKDRTGIVAALLLSVLDVDRETILDDYELTNEFVRDERLIMKLASYFFGDNDKEQEHVATIAGIKRKFMEKTLDYIDKKYGSPYNFLTQQVGVSKEEIENIRKKYLN